MENKYHVVAKVECKALRGTGTYVFGLGIDESKEYVHLFGGSKAWKSGNAQVKLTCEDATDIRDNINVLYDFRNAVRAFDWIMFDDLEGNGRYYLRTGKGYTEYYTCREWEDELMERIKAYEEIEQACKSEVEA